MLFRSYKDIDSRLLLQKCYQLIAEKSYKVGNVDSSVCLESPKIKTYIPAMQASISSLLQIDPSSVSVKATTTERLGYVGREEGVTAYATVLLQKIPS